MREAAKSFLKLLKMGKVVACIVARTVSQRLPLKVLRDLRPGLSMLDFLIQNVKTQKAVDEIYICTSAETVDDILEDVAIRNNIKIYRGSPDEVIERLLAVGEIEDAEILIRITGDNPFTDASLIAQQVAFLREENLDYVRVADLPIGATAEVFTRAALQKCNTLMDPKVSEYMMLYLFEPKHFGCGIISAYGGRDYSSYSVTVDQPSDLVRTKIILDHIGFTGFADFSFGRVLEVLIDASIDMPARIVKPSGTVKLPFDQVMSYEDFQADMQRRKDHSKTRSV